MGEIQDDLPEQAVAGIKIQHLGVSEQTSDKPNLEGEAVKAANKDSETALFIEQFVSLRDEIGRRLDIRQQIMALSLIIAGSLFALGVQPGIPETILLFYPLLAMFLAGMWAHNDLRIGQINYYIQAVIEKHLGDYGPGWEVFRRQTFHPAGQRKASKDRKHSHPLAPPPGLIAFSARGIFLTTQGLAVLIVALRFVVDVSQKRFLVDLTKVDLTDLKYIGGLTIPFLLLVNIAIIVYTGLLLKHRRANNGDS